MIERPPSALVVVRPWSLMRQLEKFRGGKRTGPYRRSRKVLDKPGAPILYLKRHKGCVPPSHLQLFFGTSYKGTRCLGRALTQPFARYLVLGMKVESGAGYPRLYRKIHQPNQDEPYASRHLGKQSSVTDSAEGIHVPTIPDRHWDKYSDVKTVHGVFEHGLRISRYLPCLGSRQTIDRTYSWLIYHEVESKIRDFGSALLNVTGFRSGALNFVGIYGRNSPEWIIAMQGCAAYSYVCVPLYDTLGTEAMKHVLQQTKLEVIVCHSIKEATYVLKNFVSAIRVVIVVQYDEECEKLKQKVADHVKLFSFKDFTGLGHAQPREKQPPNPEDLCEICYTSGSTGTPKGVMIAHEQFVDSLKGLVNTVEDKFLCQMTSHLSYLPLAHILEQMVTLAMLLHGSRIAYATTGPTSLLADIAVTKPTLFVGVPRVLSRIRSEYYKKLPKNAWMQKMLERCIVKKNVEQAQGKYNHRSVADSIFFKKFRKVMGGRICAVVSGGAPLSVEVSQFFRAALNAPVLEGYGATETVGLLSFSLPGETTGGIAGAITSGTEVKLADVPEMGLVAKRDNAGEICVRSLRCTRGYYLNEAETKNLYYDDGWMRMGDIGQWTSSGALKVVDRCKNMFKLSQGEYVAAEKVEGVYQNCNLVSFVVVDGNSNNCYAVTLVAPDFGELRKQLAGSSLKKIIGKHSPASQRPTYAEMSNEQLCEDLDVRRYVLSVMNAIAKENDLRGFEMAKSIHLTPETFSVENGLLTPTLKLARYKVRAHFKETIQRLYVEGELQV
ncbi:unnamed protein product [Calicophoron daubneyi]|uniref:long-chain-fatty-acid--CoA ligase n=1 Tax=Calicophoron daubneyi TaxID=300641 RepID=A0AAV2TNY4_CALDB